jgi:hypothetical protein
MWKKTLNKIFAGYVTSKFKGIQAYMVNPHDTQRKWFEYLLEQGKGTAFGKDHGFTAISGYKEFARQVRIREYDELKGHIHQMMMGEANVLWPGKVKWFSKSSGTTTDKSKFIPVTEENLQHCHVKGSLDTMSMLYKLRPDCTVFEGKSLIMGGSLYDFEENPETKTGDISAVMLSNMPISAKFFYTPDLETALLPDFEEKINKMVQITSQQRDMTMFGGVPTWTIVLFQRILEQTGVDHLLQLWPNMQAYIHGGVGFEPYRDTFRKFLPSDSFTYLEIYNASEGYFAIQSDLASPDLLLLLDNGIFYEFLPQSEWFSDSPMAIPLEEVEIGKPYGLVISSNSGLWRYNLGDTVEFTKKNPYKILITGRTKQFINAFGEEVMVSNTDKALKEVCRQMEAQVKEYTVAPIYLDGDKKGGHEWYIEFERRPSSPAKFADILDKTLQEINSDYEAKRFRDMALTKLTLHVVPPGTFHDWMKSRGKLGGQNKVPRLANHRKFVEQLQSFLTDRGIASS